MIIDNGFIVEDIQAIVEAMQVDGKPYYMYGHRKEIASRLMLMEQDEVFKYQKYPAIILNTDVIEHVGVVNEMVEYSLNLFIVDFTVKTYTAPERMTNVIKPILYPIYQKFIDTLVESGEFTWDFNKSAQVPEHKCIHRLFWGTELAEGNVAFKMNDPLDAIELKDFKIRKELKTC